MFERREGFTLVELSIVLIIIGLLIGGILVAQSMIGTAKNNQVIRDISQVKILTQNFVLKYNCMPGDCAKAFIPSAYRGNGDGIIGYGTDGKVFKAQLVLMGELSSSDDLSDCRSYNWDTAPLKCKYNGSLDKSMIYPNEVGSCNGSTCDLGYGPSISDPATNTGDQFLLYGKNTNTGGRGKPVVIFKPEQALALDKKVDDGIPATGKVLAFNTYPENVYNGARCVTLYSYGAEFGDPNAVYKTADTNISCGLAFYLSNAGGEINYDF